MNWKDAVVMTSAIIFILIPCLAFSVFVAGTMARNETPFTWLCGGLILFTPFLLKLFDIILDWSRTNKE